MTKEQQEALETIVRAEMKQRRGRGDQQVNEIASALKTRIYDDWTMLMAILEPPWNLSFEHPDDVDRYSFIPGLDDALRALVKRLFVEEKDAEGLKREMRAKQAKKILHQLSLFG